MRGPHLLPVCHSDVTPGSTDAEPSPLTHSRGTSWEITYRVDGRMVRQRFDSRALAVNALARARAQALDGLGIAPADGKTTLLRRTTGA